MSVYLDFAGVRYRVPEPPPLVHTRYLGENMEQASVSANIVYNNTEREVTLRIRIPFKPKGVEAKKTGELYGCSVKVPAFSYVSLQPDD